MKNKIIFKSTMVGLLIGVIMSFNMMFVGLGGSSIYTISLGFVLDSFDFSEDAGWIAGIIFFIAVYALYGFILGALINKINKK